MLHVSPQNIFLGRIMRGFFRSARHCARRVREPVGRCQAVAVSLYTHINTKASLSQYRAEGRVARDVGNDNAERRLVHSRRCSTAKRSQITPWQRYAQHSTFLTAAQSRTGQLSPHRHLGDPEFRHGAPYTMSIWSVSSRGCDR